MAQRFVLTLSAPELRTLCEARDHHPTPYVRERAAALVKVAQGASLRHVALHGLLRPHRPETVKDWVARYEDVGYAGLLLRPGRGRKPAFSPPAHPRAGTRGAAAHRAA